MGLLSLSLEEFDKLVTLIPQVQDSIAKFRLRDTLIGSSPFAVSQGEPIFSDLDSVFLPSPLSQEPISIIRDDELLDSQLKFALPPLSLSNLPPLVDPTLEKILFDLTPKEKLDSYHQDLAADEYMYGPTVNEETRVTEHDILVSTLSRSGKSNSLCKDKTETVLLEKFESSPASLEIKDSEFEGVPCIYKPTSKRQKRKTVYCQKKWNETNVKDKSPRTTVKDGNTLNEEILKPTEMNFVNSGKRKMINDCDHKCSKAVGFSYPVIVLHCSECESEKKSNKKLKNENRRPSGIFVGYAKLPYECKETTKERRKYDVKQEDIDEVSSMEAIKEVERKLWLSHYEKLSEKLMEVVRKKCTRCQGDEPNQLGYELCMMSSSEEQVNLCFEEAYKRVIWDDVMECWYQNVLEMPVNLNPETLSIFRDTVNPSDLI